MSQTNLTGEQVIDSLLEDDENAIEYHFGAPWTDLAQKNAPKFARALIFIAKRSEGLTDDDARNFVRTMTSKEVDGFFAKSSEEEAGKGEQPEPEPEPSLTSVS